MRFAVVLGALALAGMAAAAPEDGFAPRLRAEQGRFDPAAGPTVVLDVSQRSDERRTRRISFVVPPDVHFSTPPPGAVVGDLAAARGSSTLVGNLHVAGKPGSCVPHATTALTATLAAPPVSRLRLVFDVSRAAGSTRLTVCLPETGSAIRRLVVRLERGLSAPREGRSVWRALFTPAGGGRTATTESRAIVVSPSFLTLDAPAAGRSLRRGSRLRLRGSLSMPGLEAHRWIRILAGRNAASLQPVGRTRTAARGTFALSTRVPARRGSLVVQARARSRLVPCRGRSPDAPAGCRLATVGGASSNILSFVVR
jgi:hypothetical protein